MGDPTYDLDLEGAIVGEVDRSIPFIDTHHHLWELGRFRYDWLTDVVRSDGTAGPVTRQIAFAAPVRGYAINSAFGLRKLAIEAKARAHKGVDIAAPKGTGVFTAAEGRVVRTGYEAGGYGNFIEVRHPNGMSTLYAHLSRIDVTRGAAIATGQRIGLVGSTGYSTGPHLHFEVRRNDAQVNPAKVVGRSFSVAAKT